MQRGATAPATGGSRLDGCGLVELGGLVTSCQLCRLSERRTGAVVGHGNPSADVCFVTDAPGFHEDRAGHPLAGEVGSLFDELLADVGLERERVHVTSLVKCRPPRGRTPYPDEVESCEGYLFRELAIVQPRVLVTLGTLPLRVVSGRPLRLAQVHGRSCEVVLQGRELVLLPLYHPAAALHVPSLRGELSADLRQLPGLLAGSTSSDAGVPVAVPARDVSPTPASGSTAPAAPSIPAAPAAPAGEPGQLTFDIGG